MSGFELTKRKSSNCELLKKRGGVKEKNRNKEERAVLTPYGEANKGRKGFLQGRIIGFATVEGSIVSKLDADHQFTGNTAAGCDHRSTDLKEKEETQKPFFKIGLKESTTLQQPL
ncbi:hypothetical protein TNCV_4926811 [Trichonephila clavipes]|nr:hypothetical protein TNCV_4926811 [Trichonephila clavipes]